MLEFHPDLGNLWLEAAAFGLVFLAGCGAAWRLHRRPAKDARARLILPLLFFFGGLLGLFGLAGTIFSAQKFPVIAVTPREIRVDGQVYARPRSGDMRMEKVNGGLSGEQRILLLRLSDGRTLALPEDRYDLPKLMAQLK